MVGWGQSDIKDHPSPAEARVGAELGNYDLTFVLSMKNIPFECGYLTSEQSPNSVVYDFVTSLLP